MASDRGIHFALRLPVNAPIPPQSLDAEESVLGAMMLSGSAIEKVSDVSLGAGSFYRQSHGVIFSAILSLYEKNQPADAITVVNELDRTGLLEEAGGAERVHEISALVPAAANAAHYAKIVRETATRRDLIRLTNETAQKAYEGGVAGDLVAELDGNLLRLQAGMRNKQSSVFTGKDLASRFRYRLDHPEEFGSTIPPPFHFLEDQIVDGQLHILAGYQGTGKSALVWQFAEAALAKEKRVGIWTLEMTPEQLGDRLITNHGVPAIQVRKAQVDGMYRSSMESALEKLERWPVEVHNDPAITPESIRRQQRQSKYDLIIIDHLHNLPVKNPAHKRIELEEAVRKIAALAVELKVPIILLAQLSRGTLHDPFPRPTRVQLRETGMIENLAALIWFIWRKWDGTRFENEAEFICDKNRFGPEGQWWRLNFRPSQVRFTEGSQFA